MLFALHRREYRAESTLSSLRSAMEGTDEADSLAEEEGFELSVPPLEEQRFELPRFDLLAPQLPRKSPTVP